MNSCFLSSTEECSGIVYKAPSLTSNNQRGKSYEALLHRELHRLCDYYLKTICDLLPSTCHSRIGFVAFASVIVAADFAILEQHGCIARGSF